MTVGYERGRTWTWLEAFPGPNWFRRGYGKNYNVVAVFPVLLSPIILFHRFKRRGVHLAVKIFTVLALLWLVNYFGSQLGLGLLIIFALAALWYGLPTKTALILIGSIIAAGIISWPILQEYLSSGLMNDNHTGRLNLDRLAVIISGHYFINGTGLGAWAYEVNNWINVSPLKFRDGDAGNTFQTFGAFIHNHNTKMLAEIGPIGFLSYLALPVWTGIQLLRKKIPSGKVKYALIFLGWYASATTLRFAVGDDNEIAEVQLLGWLAYGWMSTDETPIKIQMPKVLLMTLSGVLLLFLSFNFWANHQQLKALNYSRAGEYEKAIEILEKIKVPFLKTTINDLEPIDRHLGRWYEELGQTEVAMKHYQMAYRMLPDDPGLVHEYLGFLKKHRITKTEFPDMQQYVSNPFINPLILFQEICVAEPADLNISLDTITASAISTNGTIQLTGITQKDLSVMGNGTITL